MLFLYGDCQLLIWLMDHGYPRVLLGAGQQTVLHRAIESKSVCLVRTLLERGTAVEYCSYIKTTPLECALSILTRKTEIVQLLLRYGANVDFVHDNRTAPWHAILRLAGELKNPQNTEIVADLLEAGAQDLDCRMNMASAMHKGDVIELMMLLAYGLISPAKIYEQNDRVMICKWFDVYSYERYRAMLAVVKHIPSDGIDPGAILWVGCMMMRARVDLIRKRATEICIALQNFRLPAFITLQIIDASWKVVSEMVPMHLKWDLITIVKHFHDRKATSSEEK